MVSLDDVVYYLVTGGTRGSKYPNSLRKARGIVIVSLSALLIVMGGSMIGSSYNRQGVPKQSPPEIKRISEIEKEIGRRSGIGILNKIYSNPSDYEHYKVLVEEYNALNTPDMQKLREEMGSRNRFYNQRKFEGFSFLMFGLLGALYAFGWLVESK